MQKYHLLFVICLLPFISSAQGLYEYFNQAEVIECPFSDGLVTWPVGWQIFHTKDNTWDGTVDSAWCISVEVEEGTFYDQLYLVAEQIDGERPVFLRYTDTMQSFLLPPTMLHQMEVQFGMEGDAQLNLEDGHKAISGARFIVDIPANDTTGRAERVSYVSLDDTKQWISGYYCFASEYFVDQYLKEVTLGISVGHSISKGRLVHLTNASVYPVYDAQILTHHDISENWWVDTAYIVPVGELGTWYGMNFILPYLSNTYPSPANISYYDLDPLLPSDTAQTITVVVEDYMTLTPQYFTAFRGALVQPGDSTRHRAILMNNGGNFCLSFVEITFGEGTGFTHRAGNILMKSDQACMMFKDGATLTVDKGSFLDYGNDGHGFLALKQGSEVVLHENAHLHIRNTAVLQLTPTENRVHPKVFLHAGSKLSFGEKASLEAWDSDAHRLQVIMLGGTVDETHLTAEEIALIEYIYPPLIGANAQPDNLILTHDYASQEVNAYFDASFSGEGKMLVTDIYGRLWTSKDITWKKGHHVEIVETSNLVPGVYVITLEPLLQKRSASFVVHR